MSKPDDDYKLIQGDTFRHRERLKELGGRWDSDLKGWWLPADTYDEARLIVDNCEGQLSFEELPIPAMM